MNRIGVPFFELGVNEATYSENGIPTGFWDSCFELILLALRLKI